MTIISILYPNKQGSRFDLDYYLHVHMPMSLERLSTAPGFQGVSVEHGLSAGVPDSQPAFIALCHFRFDTVESFLAAFTPHAELLQGDIANYTDVYPIIQVSEVKIAR